MSTKQEERWNAPEGYDYGIQVLRDSGWSLNHTIMPLAEATSYAASMTQDGGLVRVVKVSRYLSDDKIVIHSIVRTFGRAE